eukprot:5321313-Amphidinium_carterae.1
MALPCQSECKPPKQTTQQGGEREGEKQKRRESESPPHSLERVCTIINSHDELATSRCDVQHDAPEPLSDTGINNYLTIHNVFGTKPRAQQEMCFKISPKRAPKTSRAYYKRLQPKQAPNQIKYLKQM